MEPPARLPAIRVSGVLVQGHPCANYCTGEPFQYFNVEGAANRLPPLEVQSSSLLERSAPYNGKNAIAQ
jgi:hypothetical protein